jgi:hypothetical protein
LPWANTPQYVLRKDLCGNIAFMRPYLYIYIYIYITILSCMGLTSFLNLPSPRFTYCYRTAFQVAGLIQSWAHLLTSWISLIIYLRWWTSNCYQIKFLLFIAK